MGEPTTKDRKTEKLTQKDNPIRKQPEKKEKKYKAIYELTVVTECRRGEQVRMFIEGDTVKAQGFVFKKIK